MKRNTKRKVKGVCGCAGVCVCVCICLYSHSLSSPTYGACCRLSSVCRLHYIAFIYLLPAPSPSQLTTPLLSCLWFVCRRCCGVHFCGVYVTSVGFYNAGICHQALTATLTRKFPGKKEREGAKKVLCRFRQRFRKLKDEGGGAVGAIS